MCGACAAARVAAGEVHCVRPMIQKPRHAPGGVGLFNSRLGVSRWMHTLFCSGQALQEMQKDELAPGVRFYWKCEECSCSAGN